MICIGRPCAVADPADNDDARIPCFMDGRQPLTPEPLYVVYHKNACPALLIFTNPQIKLRYLYSRVVSRRIIETNRHGIFTRDMEAIHIFHIPRLFRPVEV